MKILKENKENLPIDFLTQFISKGWSDVGDLKASIEAIKREFKGTTKVEEVLQDLIDAYLIAIGQLELYLDKKDYLDIPEETELAEKLILSESAEKPEEKSDAKPEPIKPVEKKETEKISNEISKDISEDELEEEPVIKESTDSDAFEYFTDFDEPEEDEDFRATVQEWLNR